MKKTILSLLLVLCLLVSAAGFTEQALTEKATPLYTIDGEADGELTLRFYEETPHIPYIGIREYMTRVMHFAVTAEANENGTLTLKNELGGELRCDAAAGTITSPDWVKMITPKMPLEGEPHSLKDSSCAFVRITDITYEGEPVPVTFDFAKYGIRIYTDREEAWLPLSILSNMMTDIATNHLQFDGKSLHRARMSTNSKAEDPLLMNDTIAALMNGQERPADVITQGYADLCFSFDYFFGHPGVATLDAAIAEKGLDRALADLGKTGDDLKKGLLSPGFTEYLSALQKLFTVYLADGHTAALDGSNLTAKADPASIKQLTGDFFSNSTWIS